MPIRTIPALAVGSMMPLTIGYQMENEATLVTIDATAWLDKWQDAELALIVTRPTETVSYPANITVDGGVITWLVSRYDTEKAGKDGKVMVLRKG